MNTTTHPILRRLWTMRRTWLVDIYLCIGMTILLIGGWHR